MARGDDRRTVSEGDVIHTVAGDGEASLTVRGSEFIAYVRAVDDRREAEAHATVVRSNHEEATHVVPAYRVRDEAGFLREYASDDGEPSDSAGAPVLGVLTRRELEAVAVAVVRYFGGTELGVGGLARAYARTAGAAIDDAGVIDREPAVAIQLSVEYDDSGTVRGILESEAIEFDANYETAVSFEIRVPVGDRDRLLDRLRSATAGRVDIDPE